MMAGVVSTVRFLQLIHAGPTSSLLAAELGPCRRITVLVAGAQSSTGVQIHCGRGVCARAAAHGGGAAGCPGRVLPGHTFLDSMDMQGMVMAAIVNCTQGCRLM